MSQPANTDEPDTEPDESGTAPERYLEHEEVSKEIATNDEQVNRVLVSHGIDPVEVYRIFLREEPPRYANLVSSDLDADRIDYLLRTAHHTGLPHGSIDLEYLLTQIRLDADGYLCFSPKAARGAEQVLLGRYFDYQQVVWHKTVAGLEWVLKDLVRELLKRGELEGTRADIQTSVRSGEWRDMDDVLIMNKIRNLYRDAVLEASVRTKCRSLLHRYPPKVLASFERLGPRDDAQLRALARAWRGAMRRIVSELAEEWEIPEDLFHIWDPRSTGLVMTKVGAHVPVSAMVPEEAEEWDRFQQAVRIFESEDGSSYPLNEDPSSILSILSDQALFLSRVYVLLPGEVVEKREEIEQDCKRRMREQGVL